MSASWVVTCAATTVWRAGGAPGVVTAESAVVDTLVWARSDLAWVPVAAGLLVAGLYAYGALARRKLIRRLGNVRLVERLVASVDGTKRALATVAAVLATVLLAVALVRPQYGGEARVIPASGIDIVLAVDYSKSMLARDVYPSRTERLEAELRHFLDDVRRRGDRVGVVVFAGEARGLPLTRDTRLIDLYLEKADPRTEEPGGTAIGKAIRLALAFLVDARREEEARAAEEGRTAASPKQVIVLLTDGEDTASNPLAAADEAAKLGIPIYTVGIGSVSGEPIQTFDEEGNPTGYVRDEEGNYVMTRLDEKTLQEIARRTGGRYIRVASDRFGLDEVRAAIESFGAEAHRDRIEVDREEGFAYVVGPALGLLCIALALPDRRRRRTAA
ncbi:MAG: VWA domain-containing protein [Deltaproteobacteria bacterium]|nr:MAG: VWA domain-containing protein [Deltaproteobacteria bacterium]